MRRLITVLISLLMVIPTLAADGNKVLKMVEERLIGKLAPRDTHAIMLMSIVDPKGGKKFREMEVWEKNNPQGDDWRVMKFRKPADVRGVGFLVLSDDQMYLYLPEFHRIRRIASHTKKESFMGSDFSYDDMGTSGFSRYYNAKLLEEKPHQYVLLLTLKPGARKPYGKIKMWVSKESMLPVRMELYSKSGELVKISEQKAKKIGKYWIPVKIKMTSVKKGSYTVLEMKNIKLDQGISKRIFTKRFLKRRVK